MTPTTTADFDLLLPRYLAEAKSHIAQMAAFAFLVFLMPIATLLLNIQFLWLLIFPVAAALYVGRGLSSVLLVKQRAVAILKSSSPTKMSVTGISKQFLFWNSVSSPGYKLDLAPLNSGAANIQNLKVDPASKLAVEHLAVLLSKFEQAKETRATAPTTEVDVYFDEKQLPVALVLNGELVWAVYWW